ncbi:hypothetical protein Salat_2814000 [Sesamum alatum]|uniref:Uncharacterized protein n=1 Tax=Sesamum alatum TaxID=300844 RepID=A0AAE1XMA9_9LAMI|nr:hypothetical protein Salat_2814000 [Sesamum alatum]
MDALQFYLLHMNRWTLSIIFVVSWAIWLGLVNFSMRMISWIRVPILSMVLGLGPVPVFVADHYLLELMVGRVFLFRLEGVRLIRQVVVLDCFWAEHLWGFPYAIPSVPTHPPSPGGYSKASGVKRKLKWPRLSPFSLKHKSLLCMALHCYYLMLLLLSHHDSHIPHYRQYLLALLLC